MKTKQCDACGLSLARKTPSFLSLFERGFGIRRSDSNALIVCIAAANELCKLSPRDRVLRISNHTHQYICPTRNATHDQSSNIDKAIATTHKLVIKERSKAKAISQKLSTLKPVDHTDAFPKFQFSNEKINDALNRRILNTIQIQQILDQSNHLGIDIDTVNNLRQELKRLIGLLQKTYDIDKEGVVVFTKKFRSPHRLGKSKESVSLSTAKKSKDGLSAVKSKVKESSTNPIIGGYLRCQNCQSFMFYSDINKAKCRECKKNIVASNSTRTP